MTPPLTAQERLHNSRHALRRLLAVEVEGNTSDAFPRSSLMRALTGGVGRMFANGVGWIAVVRALRNVR